MSYLSHIGRGVLYHQCYLTRLDLCSPIRDRTHTLCSGGYEVLTIGPSGKSQQAAFYLFKRPHTVSYVLKSENSSPKSQNKHRHLCILPLTPCLETNRYLGLSKYLHWKGGAKPTLQCDSLPALGLEHWLCPLPGDGRPLVVFNFCPKHLQNSPIGLLMLNVFIFKTIQASELLKNWLVN